MAQKGWFKINRSSKTGQKLESVIRKKLAFSDSYIAFKEKYGINSAMGSSYYLANVNSVSFIGKPDRTQWKPVSKASKYFVPIKGTQAAKDFAKLNKNAVARWEIDIALGATSEFPEAGFDARFKDCIFVHFGQGCTYKLSEDCVPVSTQEYNRAVECGEFYSY